LPAAKAAELAARTQEGQEPEKKEEAAAPKHDTHVNVVLFADLDMLTDQFFRLREQGEVPELGMRFDFDNVTMVLNALDSLAGESRFLELRKRRPRHRTLERFDRTADEARKRSHEAREKCRADFDKATQEEASKFQDELKKLEEQIKSENANLDPAEIGRRLAIAMKRGQQRLEAQKEELEQKRNQNIDEIDTHSESEIHRLQDWYKLWAVVLPPIFPLALALFVFTYRRVKEREGVSKNRLR